MLCEIHIGIWIRFRHLPYVLDILGENGNGSAVSFEDFGFFLKAGVTSTNFKSDLKIEF